MVLANPDPPPRAKGVRGEQPRSEQPRSEQPRSEQLRSDQLPYTEGWFQVGWSEELKVGEVRRLELFGTRFVLFRGEDGKAGVLDDVCPHLGASLSVGGRVVGTSLRCPYHAWQFDRTGACTHIPYASKIPGKARTHSYTVAERYGLIFFYRNREGSPPAYSLPEIEGLDEETYAGPARFDFRIKVRGQDIMENSVDSAHFAAVHRHDMPDNAFRMEGETMRVTQSSSVGRFGLRLKFRLEFHLVEPGFHYVHFPEMPGGAAALVFSSVVPIDRDHTNHRMSIWIKKSPIPGWSWLIRRFLLWQMMYTYREDLEIWENKAYLPQPLLCDGDAAIPRLRRWFRKFYEEDPVRRLAAVAEAEAPAVE